MNARASPEQALLDHARGQADLEKKLTQRRRRRGWVPRWWYLGVVKGDYNFTLAGLRNAEQYGISPAEVWQVLHGDRRVVRMVGENSRVIVGTTAAGRYLAVMIQEDPHDDEDTWDIVAARDLPDKDVPVYERLLRRRL